LAYVKRKFATRATIANAGLLKKEIFVINTEKATFSIREKSVFL